MGKSVSKTHQQESTEEKREATQGKNMNGRMLLYGVCQAWNVLHPRNFHSKHGSMDCNHSLLVGRSVCQSVHHFAPEKSYHGHYDCSCPIRNPAKGSLSISGHILGTSPCPFIWRGSPKYYTLLVYFLDSWGSYLNSLWRMIYLKQMHSFNMALQLSLMLTVLIALF